MRRAATTIVDEIVPIAERVHHVRRTAKEGRALLKLAPPCYAQEARRQRQLLRDIRRDFGPARDSRVALSMIEERDEPGLRSARRRLERHCQAAEAALTPDRLAQVAARLMEIARTIAGWRVEPGSDDAIFAHAAKAYKKARRLMPIGDTPSLETVHAFRSAVIDHCHQMSLLAECDGRKTAERVEQLKELRAQLGDSLDLANLEARLHIVAAGRGDEPHHDAAEGEVLQHAMVAAHALFRTKPRNFSFT